MRAPLVMFTYYNPILRRGTEAFIKEIAAAGAAGLLIPDIPLEETAEARAIAARYGVQLVLLATPTTSEARMRLIAEATSGFVYLVSVTGVTGVQDNVSSRVKSLARAHARWWRGGRQPRRDCAHPRRRACCAR